MDIKIAEIILEQINNTSLTSLKTKLIKSAIRYAHNRVSWYLATTEERIETDSERTLAHNSFIDNCNILSRNMQKAGEDNDWRKFLGDDRKTIGDFACYLHCVLGIKAR